MQQENTDLYLHSDQISYPDTQYMDFLFRESSYSWLQYEAWCGPYRIHETYDSCNDLFSAYHKKFLLFFFPSDILLLANPPFKGSLDAESVSGDLLKICKTKKTELLFLALFLRIMKIGGRCACIVPDGVLFGSSRAHKSIRKEIVENQRLEAVISMPSGVFKPYAGVSTAILIFTKTEHGGTDQVWFYDMKADGFSLDDKRTPVTENDIPDIIERFKNLDKEVERKRTDQSFMVPKKDIVENDYDLSINKYKEIEYTPVEYPPTSEIMANIRELELEIGKEMDELERLLGL